MKKKLLAILTIGMILVSSMATFVSAATKTFADVNQEDWFYDAVTSVAEKELFAGTSETEFSPRDSMTRAMFVQVLANFTQNYTNPQDDEIALFTDVKKDAWYYNAVQWAAKNGIVAGKGNAVFDPGGLITRQEMITMLFNYALKTGEATIFTAGTLSGFTDWQNLSDWASTAAWWTVSNQIIAGMGDNELSPTTTSTRAQVAAMFNNAYDVMKSRETIPVIVNAPDDPDKDYLDILSNSLSLEELSKGKDMGKGDTSLMAPYTAYTGFEDYPEVTAYYLSSDANAEDVFYISVPVTELFPKLSGKTAGEVIGDLGSSAYLDSYEGYYYDYPPGYDAPYIIYSTKNFTFNIRLNKDTLKVDADAVVYISSGSSYREVLEIPDDLTVSLEFKGTTICTVTLPESYRQCIIYRKELLYSEDEQYEEGGLFFMEPAQELRYGGWLEGGTLLSIRIYEVDNDVEAGESSEESPEGPVDTYLLSQLIELDGRQYLLVAFKSRYQYLEDDQDVINSFKIMEAEVENIIDGIEINDALTLIN